MIYKKPNEAIARLVQSLNDAWCYKREWKALLEFAQQFPDSFEIVQPGNVQVRWPEGATKEHITWHADNQRGRGLIADSLYALAAIAPVEKKKRKVEIWKGPDGNMEIFTDYSLRIFEGSTNWRKVGECEVDT